jgi:hypothetical protein
MNASFFKIVLFASALSFAAKGYGQRADSVAVPRSWWFSIGAGGTTLGALSGSTSFNFESAHHWLLSANFEGETSGVFNTQSSLDTYNVLVGQIVKTRFAFFTASIGLGLADYYNNLNETSQYNISEGGGSQFSLFSAITADDRYAINVPIILQAYMVAFQRFGVGLSAYANLNTARSSAGVNINIAFGKLTTYQKKH